MNQRKKKEGERERFRGRERGWERERRCASAAKRRTEEEKGWKMGRLLYTDELCEYVNARTHLQFDGSPSLPPFSSKTPALSLSERPCLRVLENWTRACVCVNAMWIVCIRCERYDRVVYGLCGLLFDRMCVHSSDICEIRLFVGSKERRWILERVNYSNIGKDVTFFFCGGFGWI